MEENRQTEILSEIKRLVSSIHIQVEELDRKMYELKKIMDPHTDSEPIGLILDSAPRPEDNMQDDAVEAVSVAESGPEPGLPDVTGDVRESEEEAFEAETDIMKEPEEDDAFRIESASENRERMAVIDAMSARETWRTDRPGSPVKDIRSAISLNDRVLFINMLFNEDAMSFQECITRLNEVSTLDDAVDYVARTHPEWEMDSEIVYRFMMAVRRKLI